MTTAPQSPDLAAELALQLPFLRRYARALTGAQDAGDHYAVATLETIVAEPSVVEDAASTKIGLFRVFHGIWSTSGAQMDADKTSADIREARAQERLSSLTANTREALLLHSIEGFGFEEIAQIMNSSAAEAEALVSRAMAEMGESLVGNVLIIEDEGIIAMDIKSIVTEMGHKVTNVARTRADAVAKGRAAPPDLILADIQLADKSSGVDAVNDLLTELGERPVIFITAFPERLLTGERPEPAFLIAKPYSEDQVQTAVSQAMFFTSTQDMDLTA